MSDEELKLELLLDLGSMLAREVELDDLLVTFGERVATAMRADRSTLLLVDAKDGGLRSRVANLPELDELHVPAGEGIAGYVARTGNLVNLPNVADDPRWSQSTDKATGYKTRSMLCAPICGTSGEIRGVVQVLNREGGPFTDRDESFLLTLADQIARALEYTTLRAGSAPRGVSLRGPLNHIVGSSVAMEGVYERILKAAATDATVLLHGETGVGKGLFARALHVNSPRRNGPYVHVDCTTLSASLVESELFGHERGAYTGADARAIGKVEHASGGTLFLDEIGELPMGLQSKLLRFLQDRQFERVGGRETLNADVRIIAATNRDLGQMVADGTFRSDLYYRVRVVDVELPPLRDRGDDDILALGEYFLERFAQRYGKPELELTADARSALVHHAWPGNVRELEHAIERAVVLATDRVDAAALHLTLAPNEVPAAKGDGLVLPLGLSLDDAAKSYAEAVLEKNGGNRSSTARELQIGRNRLARLLKSE